MSCVLVLKDEEDQTSNFVIDWLIYDSYKYISLSTKVLGLAELELSNSNVDVLVFNQDYRVRFSEITSYWHRRGDIIIADGGVNTAYTTDKTNYLLQQQEALIETLRFLLYKKHGIGRLELNDTNKLFNLFLAREYGLSIPSTFVTNYNKVIEKVLLHGNFCTKAIKQGWYTDQKKDFNGATVLLAKNDFQSLKDITWPSLLQEYQEKRYELRIFYLDGDFYTSAIFSQNDEQTKIDFRHYNYGRPNRTPPYHLPKNIEEKLHKLMQKLTIKCGSIDMVVNTKNEFVFLEVNPFGQFQQVSFPCNYYLELKVAEYLTKYDRKEKDVC